MTKTIQVLAAGALGLSVAMGAAGAYAQDAPEDLIKTRKAVMQIFAGSLTGLGNIAQGKVSNPEHMSNYANSLAQVAALLPDLYSAETGPDSGVETRALPAIWEDPEGFQEVLQVTSERVDALVAAAESGDQAAVGAALGALGKDGCGACHTKFRARQ